MPELVKELLLGLVFVIATALVVYGLALWSLPAAFIAAGLGVAGLGFYFLVEVG